MSDAGTEGREVEGDGDVDGAGDGVEGEGVGQASRLAAGDAATFVFVTTLGDCKRRLAGFLDGTYKGSTKKGKGIRANCHLF